MIKGRKDAFIDHCGVVGVWGNEESAKLTYLALYALQHRGQDSSGIVSLDNGKFQRTVGMGEVADVFSERKLESLKGKSSVGHVRYTTAGSSGVEDAQPLLAKTYMGHIALAHNGNLVNAKTLRTKLEKKGAIFHTQADTEVICHLLACCSHANILERLKEALQSVVGAFSLCVLTEQGLVGVRDPHGVRPLVLGKLKNGYVLASEDCAFELIEAERIREIDPGEMVLINQDGITSMRLPQKPNVNIAQCIFEHVYFSRPDSQIFNAPVYASRLNMGQELAKQKPAEADVVIPVPDSGVIAALGFAKESGIPFAMGLVRNHYVGRTFIEPESKIRNFGVRLKLSPVKEVVRGKKLVVVDDSLVRGTTSKKIVKMLKAAGAKEVHLRISAPPTTNPCYYGIDTPTKEELIASSHEVDEIAEFIGVTSLGYLSAEGMHKSLYGAANGGKDSFDEFRRKMCDACFTGRYPISLNEAEPNA